MKKLRSAESIKVPSKLPLLLIKEFPVLLTTPYWYHHYKHNILDKTGSYNLQYESNSKSTLQSMSSDATAHLYRKPS